MQSTKSSTFISFLLLLCTACAVIITEDGTKEDSKWSFNIPYLRSPAAQNVSNDEIIIMEDISLPPPAEERNDACNISTCSNRKTGDNASVSQMEGGNVAVKAKKKEKSEGEVLKGYLKFFSWMVSIIGVILLSFFAFYLLKCFLSPSGFDDESSTLPLVSTGTPCP